MSSLFAQGSVVHTEVAKINGEWTFLRNNEPYYVKGVGGQVHMDEAIACGANSIRTWGLENAQAVLDSAEAKGLSVMLGFWMPHERHGFNYSNKWAVEDMLKSFRGAVEEFKDHPALLCWGVGNEVDLFYTDLNVWSATESIAQMIHELDPHHPTCAVTAGLDVAEVKLIQQMAPSIDILGVNTYGEVESVPELIELYGWEKPYMITEWGPNGHWEVQKTTWGAPIEQTSTEKANSYHQRYKNAIAANKQQCIGSYVFLWGQKQETTATWYGVFLQDGSRTQAIDVLHQVWKGSPAPNRCPIINAFTISGETKENSLTCMVDERLMIKVDVEDPDMDDLKFEWQI
ncbi:MAG: hypothetical protein NWQ53_07635, partial [Flavobacteriales bacterium]|nr:hypothetical protein [Flavobacteriales bacterium]